MIDKHLLDSIELSERVVKPQRLINPREYYKLKIVIDTDSNDRELLEYLNSFDVSYSIERKVESFENCGADRRQIAGKVIMVYGKKKELEEIAKRLSSKDDGLVDYLYLKKEY
jgi:hypothetical protein